MATKKKEIKYYKILETNGASPYLGFNWPLPKDGKPGKWIHAKGELALCSNGVHACEKEEIFNWVPYGSRGADVYEIELKGVLPRVKGQDKVVARSGRLIKKVGTVKIDYDKAEKKAMEAKEQHAEKLRKELAQNPAVKKHNKLKKKHYPALQAAEAKAAKERARITRELATARRAYNNAITSAEYNAQSVYNQAWYNNQDNPWITHDKVQNKELARQRKAQLKKLKLD